jgi:alkaline phosphatase D
MKTILIFLLSATPLLATPFQATGFKVGEVTSNSAIVWTRLTAKAKANPATAPLLTFQYANGETYQSDLKKRPKHPRSRITGVEFSTKGGVADIRYAAPGIAGEVRVLYSPVLVIPGSTLIIKPTRTLWRAVDAKADFTRQFKLTGLAEGITYKVVVETRGIDGKAGQTLTGKFKTAPMKANAARVVFTVSTGQMFAHQDRPDGFEIYPSMLKLNPDFFVHTGDILYYDALAKTPALAHWHWQRTYSRATLVEFHRQVGSYFMKDDHDTWTNDCWPSMANRSMFQFTFKQGLKIFPQQVPMGRSTYRTVRWGKDLQIWMVEGRDFRSPNNALDGPKKTIWGAEQMAWFKKTVAASDATFRLLISPTPVVGPDRDNKRDNHSNKVFAHEGDQLRAFIAKQKNMVVICGDRHWQYLSIHPKTGVREYSCGPASNQHAGGWRQSDYRKDIHQYLNVTGGFLSGSVDRKAGKPTLTFRWHDVNGKELHEDVLTKK